MQRKHCCFERVLSSASSLFLIMGIQKARAVVVQQHISCGKKLDEQRCNINSFNVLQGVAEE